MHQQLAEHGWVLLIATAGRNKPAALSIYSLHNNENVAGMAVVSIDLGEMTVLKLLGLVDFAARPG